MREQQQAQQEQKMKNKTRTAASTTRTKDEKQDKNSSNKNLHPPHLEDALRPVQPAVGAEAAQSGVELQERRRGAVFHGSAGGIRETEMYHTCIPVRRVRNNDERDIYTSIYIYM